MSITYARGLGCIVPACSWHFLLTRIWHTYNCDDCTCEITKPILRLCSVRITEICMHFCDPEFFICAIDRTVFQSVDIFVVSRTPWGILFAHYSIHSQDAQLKLQKFVHLNEIINNARMNKYCLVCMLSCHYNIYNHFLHPVKQHSYSERAVIKYRDLYIEYWRDKRPQTMSRREGSMSYNQPAWMCISLEWRNVLA